MDKQKKRIIEVDLLRGIAIVLMILGHSFIVYPVNVYQIPWCKSVSHIIYTFHMELLFIIAGYVYKCDNYKKYFIGKVKRILVPYILFGSVSILLKAYGGKAINGTVDIEAGVYRLIFFGGYYWFLYVIFLIYTIFPLVNKKCKNSNYLIMIMFFIAVAQLFIESNFLQVHNFLKYTVYFMCGYILSQKKLKSEIIFNHQIIFYIVAALIWYMSNKAYCFGIAIAEYIRALAISGILAVFIIKNLKIFHRLKWLKQFLEDASTYSLQLYLFNGYLLVLSRVFIYNIMRIENPIIIVAFIWISNCTIPLLLCKLIIIKNTILSNICGIKRY